MFPRVVECQNGSLDRKREATRERDECIDE